MKVAESEMVNVSLQVRLSSARLDLSDPKHAQEALVEFVEINNIQGHGLSQKT